MKKIIISGTGLFTPHESISNQELVASFNKYVNAFNAKHRAEIAAGTVTPLAESDVDFIIRASGIKNRYVMNKAGILDTHIMCPLIPERPDAEMSIQCEIAIAAAKQALATAKKKPEEIDAVIVSCSYLQRAYPAISIEIQNALGISGFGFDMNVACSSVTFGMQAATALIASGAAKSVLLVNPEIATPQVNFCDRESHFIFGDVATAMVIEGADVFVGSKAFEIVSLKLKTQFSNNIRSNFGHINRAERAAGAKVEEKLFKQEGRKVFKEVVPLAVDLISEHLAENSIAPHDLKRLWLHQANSNMNRLVASRLLNHEPTEKEAPVILDEYANTASAGVAIVFHKYHEDLQIGDMGIMCSFGAGYSIGNVILRRMK